MALTTLMNGSMRLVAGDDDLILSVLFFVGGVAVRSAKTVARHRYGLSPLEAWALRKNDALAGVPAWSWPGVVTLRATDLALGASPRAYWAVAFAVTGARSSRFLAWQVVVARHARADWSTPVA